MQEERAKRAGSRRRAGAGLLRGRLLLPPGGAAGSAREDGRPCSGGAARKEQLPSWGPEEKCSSPGSREGSCTSAKEDGRPCSRGAGREVQLPSPRGFEAFEVPYHDIVGPKCGQYGM